jgi:uncharacterized circularly permuted ATP-grasp superfamily protein
MNYADLWESLVAPEDRTIAALTKLAQTMRERKATFGDRLHCPFLRPFFLDTADEARVRRVGETLAAIGERVVEASLADPALLAQAGLSEEEERLVRIEPGYRRASTASRLDSFLLPDSLMFAEYNAESPAGLGYSQTLSEIFAALPVMERFRKHYRAEPMPIMEALLQTLLASYEEWGGTAHPPQIAIVDFREVPTWSEFEILQDRFQRMGVPTLIADPRDLDFSTGVLTAQGKKIDLVYRRVLLNDIVARPVECRALVDAYAARAVCVANTLRCKIPHKKAFFAVLHDPRNQHLFSGTEREIIRGHIPVTQVLTADVAESARARRGNLVLKPNDEYGGTGVFLGWEMSVADWDEALQRAVTDAGKVWIVQERIPVRREDFPTFTLKDGVTVKEMLVDFSPYFFRGKLSGFLTRLSATGLANVTSGGGQVPAFVVEPNLL